jgi:hypothetical protein
MAGCAALTGMRALRVKLADDHLMLINCRRQSAPSYASLQMLQFWLARVNENLSQLCGLARFWAIISVT